LRNRIEDIPLLVTHFIKKYSKNEKKDQLPLNVVSQLQEYNWPGNVRELQNMVQRYLATQKIDFLEPSGKKIEVNDDHRKIDMIKDLKTTLDAYEKQVIESSLERHDWHRGKAAKELGIDYRTLLRKMIKLRTKKS